MSGASDDEVLRGASVTVHLCGRPYRFDEPPRRQARSMMAGALDIHPLIASGSQSDQLRAADKMVEWLMLWCEPMRRDRAIVENAEEDQIAAAFGAVMEMLTVPFARTAERLARERADSAGEGRTSTQTPAP